ncbi:MAG: 5-oxoprolinase subunit PxpA [Pseudomonadota bacterium]
MPYIDLNADLGEGDPYDEALLGVVSSCNIACGGHTGDRDSMVLTVALAMRQGVALGAHPSYPDKEGYGRRSEFLGGIDLQVSLQHQIEALQAVIQQAGGALQHVKPHGALYNDTARDAARANVVASAVLHSASGAVLVGPPNSALQAVAKDRGIRYRCEAFADRAYRADGQLVPRSEPGAVHSELSTITTQATRLALHREVTAQSGEVISVAADTLCIHGDTDNADVAAQAIFDVLTANGIEIHA